jgi:hypothetical protein
MAEIGFGNQRTCADALALTLMIGLAGLRVLAPARSLKISRENTQTRNSEIHGPGDTRVKRRTRVFSKELFSEEQKSHRSPTPGYEPEKNGRRNHVVPFIGV